MSRRGGKPRLWVEVDEFGEVVPLTAEQTVRLRERAQNLCVWHLGQGPRTRRQLDEAMTRRGVPEEMREDVLAVMVGYGWVDDAQFAVDYVQSRHTNQRKAGRVIASELRRKGVEDAAIEAALEQIDPDAERANAEVLVARKLASTAHLDPRKRTQRLAGLLVRRGYGPGLAFEVVRAALDNEATKTG